MLRITPASDLRHSWQLLGITRQLLFHAFSLLDLHFGIGALAARLALFVLQGVFRGVVKMADSELSPKFAPFFSFVSVCESRQMRINTLT